MMREETGLIALEGIMEGEVTAHIGDHLAQCTVETDLVLIMDAHAAPSMIDTMVHHMIESGALNMEDTAGSVMCFRRISLL